MNNHSEQWRQKANNTTVEQGVKEHKMMAANHRPVFVTAQVSGLDQEASHGNGWITCDQQMPQQSWSEASSGPEILRELFKPPTCYDTQAQRERRLGHLHAATMLKTFFQTQLMYDKDQHSVSNMLSCLLITHVQGAAPGVLQLGVQIIQAIRNM